MLIVDSGPICEHQGYLERTILHMEWLLLLKVGKRPTCLECKSAGASWGHSTTQCSFLVHPWKEECTVLESHTRSSPGGFCGSQEQS